MNPKKDFISFADFSREEINELLLSAWDLKRRRRRFSNALFGKTLAMIFQKPSTRTNVSFAVGMVQLGGFPLILNPQELQLKRGETLPDTARILSRFVDGIMIRAHRHADVLELAECSSVPILNGLTEKEHPCQVLADIFTIFEKRGLKHPQELAGVRLAYLGDGNNMAHSLLLAGALLGMRVAVASPKQYAPEKEYVARAQKLAKRSGAEIVITSDPLAAAKNADVLYTDVWASMGKEDEHETRKKIFFPYQLNRKVASVANKAALIMHCLPAHRGEEITSELMDGPNSVVFDQAENRLHAQKAVLLRLL